MAFSPNRSLPADLKLGQQPAFSSQMSTDLTLLFLLRVHITFLMQFILQISYYLSINHNWNLAIKYGQAPACDRGVTCLATVSSNPRGQPAPAQSASKRTTTDLHFHCVPPTWGEVAQRLVGVFLAPCSFSPPHFPPIFFSFSENRFIQLSSLKTFLGTPVSNN